jgi:hypothetical protein
MRIPLSMVAACLGLALATSCVGATELPMPRVPNQNALCQRSGQQGIINDCLRRAQEGYDFSVSVWPEISDVTARHCTEIVNHQGLWAGTYDVLAQCLMSWYYDYDLQKRPAPPFRER